MLLALVTSSATHAQETTRVATGSKMFTESIILGDVLAKLAEAEGAEAGHRRSLGGTGLVHQALLIGDIDGYVEYTGTLRQELYADQDVETDDALRTVLIRRGIQMSEPLGFNNGYALGMKRERAEELGIRTLSDLRDHPDLRMAFSNEFAERSDGWPAVRDFYGLPQTDVGGMDHAIAYRALEGGQADVTELYTTDAEIQKLDLVALEDDRQFFPRYDAVILYRQDLADRAPAVVDAWLALTGTISESEMIALNARAVVDGLREPAVADEFLNATESAIFQSSATPTLVQRLVARTLEHLGLVAASVALGIVTAIPLGIVAAGSRAGSAISLTFAGLVQTIPSLALLALLVTITGRTGPVPAIFALWLYSLLPMVRNTHAGLTGIARPIRESAEALGLSWWQRLTRIELPLALPSILAGIKTSAVITVGFATLGALINAGGYGQPILSGLRRLDNSLILEGAIPAAALALVVQFGLDLVGKVVVPRGLASD
ncbi:MAG: glycine betaine ABC transporter substrate-binding protein [Planctomycetota bacterium]